jgi:hypothetical protein
MSNVDDFENYEPPCPCAQQLIGIMFGCITGIIGMILSKSVPVVSLIMVNKVVATEVH